MKIDQESIVERFEYHKRQYRDILSEFNEELELTKISVSSDFEPNIGNELMASLQAIKLKIEKLVEISETYGKLIV